MLKFIESDASGLPRKRKQVSHACEPCRRRKKRCHHVDDAGAPVGATKDHRPGHSASNSISSTSTSNGHRSSIGRATASIDGMSDLSTVTVTTATATVMADDNTPRPSPPQPSSARWTAPSTARPSHSSPVWHHPSPPSSLRIPGPAPAPPASAADSAPVPVPVSDHQADRLSWRDAHKARSKSFHLNASRPNRFVGDTNPEVLFIEAISPVSSRDNSGRGGVGAWQTQTQSDRTDTSNTPNDDGASFPRARPMGPHHRAFQDMLHKYVWDHCLTCRPPPAEYAALRQIYLTKLDPIFPALSEPLSRQQPLETPAEFVVQQVVSLAAASDPSAAKYLRLGHGANILDCSSFCASLSSSIQSALDAGVITDRVLLTRILMVFSLYMHPPCAEDADVPALLHSQAVHQMVTLGIHLELGDKEKDPERTQETCTLFCCLWALDRMNAAFYGRACLMHERDFGWDVGKSIDRQTSAFRLFLRVIELIDVVFDLYRPILKTRESLIVDMPIFEQLIMDADAHKVTDATLASIEVFYHAVAILSCRYPEGSKESAMPAPATNSRRSLAADRITQIVGQEFLGRLSYLPFIPYAVSLSLSVAYRKMRFSSVPMFRQRGRKAFRTNTAMLKVLGDSFWTARTLAGMAEQMSREMDKAAASLIEGEANGSNASRKQSIDAVDSENGAASGRVGTLPGTPGFGMAHVAAPGIGGGASGAAGDDLEARLSQMQAYDADVSNVADMRDIDVFGHLDPTFDIRAVDAALECNLDFGTSSNWFDVQQLWG